MNRARRGAALLAAGALAAALLAGCRDTIAPPTEGRIQLTISGAAGVDVYVDGEFVATDPAGPFGPFPEGTHTVSVERACFQTLPARDVDLVVTAGGIAKADFTLEPRDFGSVRVLAHDELTGAPVAGAEIYREVAPDQFEDTGLATPATVDSLPCGPVRLRLAHPDSPVSDPLEVSVDTGATTDADFELGPLPGVVAEMFTYVVCPNCPQAAAELASIRDARPGQVWVIEWHTYQGLPLYSDEGKAREEYYLGPSSPGWPLVIFQGDGANWLLGSQSATLAEYWTRVDGFLQACRTDCPIILGTETTIGGGRADATARVKLRSGTAPPSLMLRWVAVEDSVIAPGNQPYFDGVPRAVHEEPLDLPLGQVVVRSWGLDLDPSWVEAKLRWVVMVQSDADHRVLAVHGSE